MFIYLYSMLYQQYYLLILLIGLLAPSIYLLKYRSLSIFLLHWYIAESLSLLSLPLQNLFSHFEKLYLLH